MMRSLVLMILLLLCAGDALHAQRTDLDSLVQAIGRWEKDREPGDTAGLIQMNRAAVVYTMRMKGDEVVEMARRTAAVASKEMGALPEGALRKGVRKQLIIALNFLGDGLVYQGDASGGMETLQRCYALSWKQVIGRTRPRHACGSVTPAAKRRTGSAPGIGSARAWPCCRLRIQRDE
ncbi:MAG: hypothetical protein R2815_11395 [Flavobacteriales bacterium]